MFSRFWHGRRSAMMTVIIYSCFGPDQAVIVSVSLSSGSYRVGMRVIIYHSS